MYVCMHVCMYVCIVYIHIYIHTYIYIELVEPVDDCEPCSMRVEFLKSQGLEKLEMYWGTDF
jgi:hypothetical protein